MEKRDVAAGNIKSSLPHGLPEEYVEKRTGKIYVGIVGGFPFGNRVRGFILTMVFYKSVK